MSGNRRDTGSTLNPLRTDKPLSPFQIRFVTFPWGWLVLALASVGVIIRLPTHFWLDETMSYWTASRGFEQILARCALWPQAVLYSSMILGLRSAGLQSEWVYRLPSVLAMATSTFLLFRLSRRLFSREIAWMTTAVFVSMPSVTFAAGDARPYALALLFVVVSSDVFVTFISRPGYKLAILYGLSSAAILYFQVLFGVVMISHGLYLVYRVARRKPVPVGPIVVAMIVLVVLAAPVVFQYRGVAANSAAHSFAGKPGLDELALAYMPVNSWFLFEILAFAALLGAGLKWQAAERNGWPLFAILWALVPPAILFAVAKFSVAHIFIARYILSYTPGFAMCMGVVLASFRPRLARAAILSLFALFALRAIGTPSSFHHTQNLGDWGAAASFVNQNIASDHAPVLVRSQFTESDYYPLTPVEDNGVFAQISYYPIHGRIIPWPSTFTPKQAASLHAVLQTLRRESRRFLFVASAGPTSLEPWIYYIRGSLGTECAVRELANFDGVSVTEYRFP